MEDRYVDDSGRPLKANESPYPEFKMMPVHMKLIMDQSKVPDLLVQCANSNMPVEVRALRLGLVEGSAEGKGPAEVPAHGMAAAPQRKRCAAGRCTNHRYRRGNVRHHYDLQSAA